MYKIYSELYTCCIYRHKLTQLGLERFLIHKALKCKFSFFVSVESCKYRLTSFDIFMEAVTDGGYQTGGCLNHCMLVLREVDAIVFILLSLSAAAWRLLGSELYTYIHICIYMVEIYIYDRFEIYIFYTCVNMHIIYFIK